MIKKSYPPGDTKDEVEVDPSSIMGGNFWADHGDGKFTPHTNNSRGGFSWLGLYAMGLADAEEVPDMFLLRNLQPDNDPDTEGSYTGDAVTTV